MVGIMGAKLMVAINNDPNSPVLSLFIEELSPQGKFGLTEYGSTIPNQLHVVWKSSMRINVYGGNRYPQLLILDFIPLMDRVAGRL
jgi:hypothetical protein